MQIFTSFVMLMLTAIICTIVSRKIVVGSLAQYTIIGPDLRNSVFGNKKINIQRWTHFKYWFFSHNYNQTMVYQWRTKIHIVIRKQKKNLSRQTIQYKTKSTVAGNGVHVAWVTDPTTSHYTKTDSWVNNFSVKPKQKIK